VSSSKKISTLTLPASNQNLTVTNTHTMLINLGHPDTVFLTVNEYKNVENALS
jgi:hypothetical protein